MGLRNRLERSNNQPVEVDGRRSERRHRQQSNKKAGRFDDDDKDGTKKAEQWTHYDDARVLVIDRADSVQQIKRLQNLVLK